MPASSQSFFISGAAREFSAASTIRRSLRSFNRKSSSRIQKVQDPQLIQLKLTSHIVIGQERNPLHKWYGLYLTVCVRQPSHIEISSWKVTRILTMHHLQWHLVPQLMWIYFWLHKKDLQKSPHLSANPYLVKPAGLSGHAQLHRFSLAPHLAAPKELLQSLCTRHLTGEQPRPSLSTEATVWRAWLHPQKAILSQKPMGPHGFEGRVAHLQALYTSCVFWNTAAQCFEVVNTGQQVEAGQPKQKAPSINKIGSTASAWLVGRWTSSEKNALFGDTLYFCARSPNVTYKTADRCWNQKKWAWVNLCEYDQNEDFGMFYKASSHSSTASYVIPTWLLRNLEMVRTQRSSASSTRPSPRSSSCVVCSWCLV